METNDGKIVFEDGVFVGCYWNYLGHPTYNYHAFKAEANKKRLFANVDEILTWFQELEEE